jgi:hypothetical protein
MLSLTAAEYFDPKYRLSGKDAISSEPRYQEAWRYVEGKGSIVATTLTIADARFKRRRVVAASYWNGMESQLTEVRENGVGGYRELISSQTVLIAGNSGWLVERWSWEKGCWRPTSCSFVEQLQDGSQRDNPIDVED